MESKQRALDQFFTQDGVALRLTQRVQKLMPLSYLDYTLLEPSARGRAFIRAIHRVFPEGTRLISMDKDPSFLLGISGQDFLTYKLSTTTNSAYVVIGNPPFGKNASLAVKFFNHAATFASMIAFVVPLTFRKDSIRRRLVQHMKLVEEIELKPEEQQYHFGDVMKHVPTCFQIYIKDVASSTLPPPPPPRTHPDFLWLKSGDSNNDNHLLVAIRRVGAVAGRIFTGQQARIASVSSHFFVQCATQDVMDTLCSIDFEHDTTTSRNNTAGNPSLTKADIVNFYSETKK